MFRSARSVGGGEDEPVSSDARNDGVEKGAADAGPRAEVEKSYSLGLSITIGDTNLNHHFYKGRLLFCFQSLPPRVAAASCSSVPSSSPSLTPSSPY